jgi:Uma2 family endonuclease
MDTDDDDSQRPAIETPEPAWDVAYLFPAQGTWSEAEYLALQGNRLVEFTNGFIEVLAMPTLSHQRIVAFLYRLLFAFVSARKHGEVHFAPIRVQLWSGKFREPDLVFMSAERARRQRDDYWVGADLAVEVVSSADRRRDLETKRHEYARAGITEYWIVDPEQQVLTVLTLDQDRYAVHGAFTAGQTATSPLLAGIEVEVSAVFTAG